jgi:hypothetical protein
MSISTCSIQPVPGLRCLTKLACVFQAHKYVVREYFLVQFGPARDTTARHAQVDQVPGVFAKSPRALVIAWYTESQIRGYPGHALISEAAMQGQAAYFSGWILTSSTPRTCGINVSRLAATQQSSGQRTSAFRYLLSTGAVSLAGHKLHNAEPTYSAISIAQMPVPQPTSRMRGGSPCCGARGTGAWCSWSRRATVKSLW